MSLPHPNTAPPLSASILVVDDTSANLQVLDGMLKSRGYKVRPVPSGKLALQAARRDPPDLILLDINMPDMNGYTVCEELKSDDRLKGIPVIFISALTEQLDKVKAFATGGVDYITKPFQMEELDARVETHLKLRRLQTDLQAYAHHLEAARAQMQFDLDLARDVQRSFLPLLLPEVPGYELFTHYEPAHEVGGDYYDVIPVSGNRVAVLLGDVVGKGVAAALMMAKLSADARFCFLTEPDPAAAVTKLNSLVCQTTDASRFVTLVAAVLDPADHSVTVVNAGHPRPLLYRRATCDLEEVLRRSGTDYPLGVIEGHSYGSCELFLQPGESLLAFTDGVVEAMDVQGRQLGTAALYATIRGNAFSPSRLAEHVVDVVRKHTAGREQQDDIALVGFGRIDAFAGSRSG